MLFDELNFCDYLENARKSSAIYSIESNIKNADIQRLTLPKVSRKEFVESFYNLQEGLLSLHFTKLNVDLIRYFSYVLISGRYCLLDELKNDLRDLEVYLTQYSCYEVSEKPKIPIVFDGVYKKLIEKSNSIIYEGLITVYQHVKNLLLNFIKNLEVTFSFESQNIIFSLLKNKKLNIPEKEKSYLNGFEIILEIYRVEHFDYEPNDQTFRKLLLLKRSFLQLELSNSEKDELKKIVEIKCDFLLYKISKRTGKDLYSYIEDNERIDVSLNNREHLKNWISFIDVHYFDSETSKKEQRKNLSRLSDLDFENYSFIDFHTYIKLCKDDFKRSDTLEEINKSLKLKEFKLDFDKNSLKILKSYAFNNNISLELENTSLPYEKLLNIYESIRSYQHTNNIKNYFPWLKLANYLIVKIEGYFKEIVQGNEEFKLDKNSKIDLDNLLSLFKKCCNKLKSAFEWSRKINFKPYQNDLLNCKSEESFNILEFGELRLFFCTSYVLPLNYKLISEEVNLVDAKKHQIESFNTTFEHLNTLIEKIKFTNNELNDSKNIIKQQERRSIEVLGIFSAVALFSIGSIQIFKDNSQLSLNAILNFILAFGFSLSLFIYLIWIITRENLKKLEWYHFIVLFLYAFAFYLIYKNISSIHQILLIAKYQQ